MLASGFIEKLTVDFLPVGLFVIIELVRYLLLLTVCKLRCVNIGAVFWRVGELEYCVIDLLYVLFDTLCIVAGATHLL